ncbi:hypothetical protein INT45_012278 [Circinella minor]|uniref:Uncharacterized protein n=1 Tax=Circinella minor TaxID=1195481 RepID=A0A8H7S5A1_9FUNG|nr:hypothetical protein INT45_012278 [Circinella minor]
MTIKISQLRSLSFSQHKKAHPRKKSLSVKISKEPPVIHKIEQDKLEYTFECIFDPVVCHDSEEDHPDLLFGGNKKRLCKPWEVPPYADEPRQNNTMSLVFKRFTGWGPKHKSNQAIVPAISPV